MFFHYNLLCLELCLFVYTYALSKLVGKGSEKGIICQEDYPEASFGQWTFYLPFSIRSFVFFFSVLRMSQVRNPSAKMLSHSGFQLK